MRNILIILLKFLAHTLIEERATVLSKTLASTPITLIMESGMNTHLLKPILMKMVRLQMVMKSFSMVSHLKKVVLTLRTWLLMNPLMLLR